MNRWGVWFELDVAAINSGQYSEEDERIQARACTPGPLEGLVPRKTKEQIPEDADPLFRERARSGAYFAASAAPIFNASAARIFAITL